MSIQIQQKTRKFFKKAVTNTIRTTLTKQKLPIGSKKLEVNSESK